MSSRCEIALAIITALLLGLVLTSWPGNNDLGTWCGVINHCPEFRIDHHDDPHR